MRTLLRSVGFGIITFWAISAHAITFPALTGRVVDDAHVLSPETIQTLDADLAAQEQVTTNQIVVVTLPSLQGVPIEDFGYQLGRAWGIGQKGKNNGVLLIFAPHERKVRIEVGYGLEGTLTDALCSQIIQYTIIPHLKQNDFNEAANQGVAALEFNLPSNASAPSQSVESNDTLEGIIHDPMSHPLAAALLIIFLATGLRFFVLPFLIALPLYLFTFLVASFLKACGNPRLLKHLRTKEKWTWIERFLFQTILFSLLSGGRGGSSSMSDSSSSSSSGSDSGSSGGGGDFGGGGSSGDY